MARHDEKTSAGRAKMLSRGDTGDRLVAEVDEVLGCLKANEWIVFKLALFAYKCQHGAAASYVAGELSQRADFEDRRRLRSASSPSLFVCRTRLSSVDHRLPSHCRRHSSRLERSTAARHHHYVIHSRLRTYTSSGAATLDYTIIIVTVLV